jgi:hypothetical protein
MGEEGYPGKRRRFAAGALILVTVVSALVAINLAGSNDPKSEAKQDSSGSRMSWIIVSAVVAIVSVLVLAIVEWRFDRSTFPWKSFVKPNLFIMTLSLAASVLAHNLVSMNGASQEKTCMLTNHR